MAAARAHPRRGGARLRPAAAVGAVLVLVLVAGCSQVDGSAEPVAPSASHPTAGGKSAAPPDADRTPAPSGATDSPGRAPRAPQSSTAAAPPGPAAGLPHGPPLPDDVLVDSRIIDGVSDLYLVATGTGALVSRLTTGLGGGQYPVISPDRATIAYLWHGSAGETIKVVATDGSGDRSLLAPDAAQQCPHPGRPGWNPTDPTEVVLTCRTDTGSRLHLIDLDDGEGGVGGVVRRTLDPGMTVVEDPTFSPDGRQIAFWGADDASAGGGRIAVLPADGSGPARPVTDPGDAQDVDPMWADGTSLVFRRSVPGSDRAQILAVQVTGPVGQAAVGPVTEITDGSAFDFDPTVAPDGRALAFKSTRSADGLTADHRVWVQNLDGSGLRQLSPNGQATSAGAPEWGRR